MILANGTRLHNRYLIDALVGQGGMGAVYRGTDLHLGHTVAIKENLFPHDESEDHSDPSDPSAPASTGSRRSQFEREAQMLARLKHSGLPKVTDHFVIPDQGQYLVMEFVEGEDLSTRLKRNGPMTEREAIGIAIRVCDVLTYLHGQRPPIIHRDLKPANIRLTPEGDIVVVDFGVAKLFTSEATVTAARAVTPGFSPLEQYGGTQSTDERSDIYALGATIHQLVVGKRPPEAPMRVTASAAAGQAWLEMPNVSAPLATILRRAMEMRPEDRFAKIGEVAAALRAVPLPPENTEATSAITAYLPVAGQVTQPMAGTDGPTFAVPPAAPAGHAPATAGLAPTMPPTVLATPPAGPPHTGSAGPTAAAPTAAAPPPAAVPPAPPPPAGPPRMTEYQATVPVSGPPIEEKKKGNKVGLFIGVGVVLLALLGGGTFMMMSGGGKKPPAVAAVVPPPDRSSQDPPQRPAEEVPGSHDQSAQLNTPSDVVTSAPPVTKPVSSASSPALTPPAVTQPAVTPPVITPPKGPAAPSPGGGTPASGTASNATPPQERPRDNGNLVPLTDNPGGSRPGPAGSTATNPPASTPQPALTPPTLTPPVTAPAVTPPVTAPAVTPPVTAPAVTPPAVKTLGDTLVVNLTGGGGSYSSVQDAVRAANDAQDGKVRTLLIRPGTYSRATILYLGRSARVIGDGPPGSVIIEASGIGLSLEGAGILVRNLVVRSGAKVAANVQGQARIEGCQFSSTTSSAVQVQGKGDAVFSNCRFTGSGESGLLAVGGRSRLEGCEISGNKRGVNTSGSGVVTMTGGSIKDNQRSGVRASSGGSVTLTDCSISGNQLNGVEVEGGAVTLRNCKVTGNRQFGVSCFGGGSRVAIDGGDLRLNLAGAVEDSCGAVTKTGSVQEK